MVGEYSAEQLIFIDESAKDERSLSREYGYALINTRAQKKIVFVRGKRYSILPALSLEEIIGFEIIEDGYDKEKFKNFIFLKVVSHDFEDLLAIALCTHLPKVFAGFADQLVKHMKNLYFRKPLLPIFTM